MILTFLSLALCQKAVLLGIRCDIWWPSACLLLDLQQGINIATKEAIRVGDWLLSCPVLGRPFKVPCLVRLEDDLSSLDGMINFRGDPRSYYGPLFLGVRTRLILEEFGTGAAKGEKESIQRFEW